MKGARSLFGMLLGLFLLTPSVGLFAQASLASEDMIQDLVISVDGHKESFTVVRDFYQADQWYYIPDRPRLAMDGNLPRFRLIKYQVPDPKHPQETLDGGVLQFAVKMNLPVDAQDKLKDAIVDHLKIRFPKLQKFLGMSSAHIRLAPIPFTSAMVTVYDLEKGLMMTDAPQQPGVAPTFATQEIPFQMNLTGVGAKVMEALTQKGGGVPVLITFRYPSVTPPCGFTIQVDWDMVYRHFSADAEDRVKCKFEGMFNFDGGVGLQVVKDLMKTKKAIRVTVESGEAFKDEDIDKFMVPVLTRINNEIFDNTRPPPIADPAKIPVEPGKNWFSKAMDSLLKSDPLYKEERHLALKAKEFRKKGSETFNMTRQMIVERTSCFGGLIGIGHLPADVQNDLVEFIPAGNWERAYFTLPAVGDDPNLGIKSIDLTVSIVDKDGKSVKGAPGMQSASWHEVRGRWEAKGQERTALVFPLAYLYEKYPKKVEGFQFKTTVKISYKFGKISFTAQEPMFDGEKPVSASLDYVDVVRIYGRNLGFAGDEEPGSLEMVDVTVAMKNPGLTVSGRFMGEEQEDNPLLFLVRKPAEDKADPVRLTMDFHLTDGKVVHWKHNSEKDIREVRPSLTFLLSRNDWEK